jgi:hypothetical protein
VGVLFFSLGIWASDGKKKGKYKEAWGMKPWDLFD